MLDLPGFGRSGRANAKYAPERYAAVLSRVIAAYGPGPVDVVGHSMGGAISLYHAAAYPEQVRRLIVVDAAGILHRDAWFGHHMRRVTGSDPPRAAAGGGQAGRDRRLHHRHLSNLRSRARSGAGVRAAAAEAPGRQARTDRRARADPDGLQRGDRAHPRADADRVGRRRHGRAAAHRADARRSPARRAAGRLSGHRSPGDGAGAGAAGAPDRTPPRRHGAARSARPRGNAGRGVTGQGACATASRTSS